MTDPAKIRGVCMEGTAAVEDFVLTDVFLYNTDIVDGSMIGELARWSAGKHSTAVRLLSFNSLSGYVCFQYQSSLQSLSLSTV